MSITDILSLEADWVSYYQLAWGEKYPQDRFMGVSSNEYCIPSAYTTSKMPKCDINSSNAVNNTIDPRYRGIGYHYSTDKYNDLRAWFDNYVLQIKKEANAKPGAYPKDIMFRNPFCLGLLDL